MTILQKKYQKYKENPETCNASGLYYWEISKICQLQGGVLYFDHNLLISYLT